MKEKNKSSSPPENSNQIPDDTKKGCLATAALLTWLFPPLWPVAIATTWAMYPKTSKIVALSLAGTIIALIAGTSLQTSINNSKTSPESESSTTSDNKQENAYPERKDLNSANYSKIEAEVKCRRTVKENLKDPGSLRIGWGDVVSGQNADNQGEWLVKFPFRARNSFNAVTPGFAQCAISRTTGEITFLDIQ